MHRTKLATALTLALALSIPAAAGWAQPLTARDTAASSSTTDLWQTAWRGVLSWWEQATAVFSATAGSNAQNTAEFGSQMDPNG